MITNAATGLVLVLLSAWPLQAQSEQLRLEVDLSDRVLTVHRGNEVVDTFPVAVGQPGHETPTGEFTISRIIWNPTWVPPDSEWAEDAERKEPGEPSNPMQGAKLFFKYPTYYIHGTNAPSSLGSAASHGCVRMKEDDVQQLARMVQEAGEAHRPDRWYKDVIANEKDLREVTLSEPVPVRIHD